MNPIKITLDTNYLNIKSKKEIDNLRKRYSRQIQLFYTTVSDREQSQSKHNTTLHKLVEPGIWDESEWDNSVWIGLPLYEPGLVGESEVGFSIVVSDHTQAIYMWILGRISNGSLLNKPVKEFTHKEKTTLRDALILTTHLQYGNDIFLTQNYKDFGERESRKSHRVKLRYDLESKLSTQIMDLDELEEYLFSHEKP